MNFVCTVNKPNGGPISYLEILSQSLKFLKYSEGAPKLIFETLFLLPARQNYSSWKYYIDKLICLLCIMFGMSIGLVPILHSFGLKIWLHSFIYFGLRIYLLAWTFIITFCFATTIFMLNELFFTYAFFIFLMLEFHVVLLQPDVS